jgi:hypothetical protein
MTPLGVHQHCGRSQRRVLGSTRRTQCFRDAWSPRAPSFGSIDARGSIVTVPGHVGYWIIGIYGKLYAAGDAQAPCSGELSSCTQNPRNGAKNDRIVAAAAKSSGKGLWPSRQTGRCMQQATRNGTVTSTIVSSLRESWARPREMATRW